MKLVGSKLSKNCQAAIAHHGHDGTGLWKRVSYSTVRAFWGWQLLLIEWIWCILSNRLIYDKFCACSYQGKTMSGISCLSDFKQTSFECGDTAAKRVMTAAPAAAFSCNDFTSRTLSAGSAWATLQRKAWRRRLRVVITYQCLTKKISTQVLLWAVYNKSFKISQCSHHFPAGCLLLRSCGNLGLVFRRPLLRPFLSKARWPRDLCRYHSPSPRLPPQRDGHQCTSTPQCIDYAVNEKPMKHWRGLEYSILVWGVPMSRAQTRLQAKAWVCFLGMIRTSSILV